MFFVTYVTVIIQNVLLWLQYLVAWRRLRHWSMASSTTLFHSNSHINQMSPQIIYILRLFFW